MKLKTDRIICVLESKILVYNFSDLKLLDILETCANPNGICSINSEGDYCVLACPAITPGHIAIMLY